jgi:hypothetical protein
MDVAGVVEAVGTQVTRFRPGAGVFGWCDGALAESACAPEGQVVAKPAALGYGGGGGGGADLGVRCAGNTRGKLVITI